MNLHTPHAGDTCELEFPDTDDAERPRTAWMFVHESPWAERHERAGSMREGRYLVEVQQVICSVTGRPVANQWLVRYTDTLSAPRTLAVYMRLVRHGTGLSQAQLAKAMDVSHGTIKYWESGERYPSMGRMLRWCEATGTSLRDVAGFLERDSKEGV